MRATNIVISANRTVPYAPFLLFFAVRISKGKSVLFKIHNAEPDAVFELSVTPNHLFCWEPLAELRKAV
jgi:hypothetical protein